MKLFLCVWLSFSICGSSFAVWHDITMGPTYAAVLQSFQNLDYSVAFMLRAENYANQHLTVSQSIIKSGVIVDDAKNIRPGMAEGMSGRKPWMTATGCHGVVSWKIGSTGKMLVVMYDLPYKYHVMTFLSWVMSDDHLWYNNMLAVGIFPQGDITEHYNMMYYGAEDGFKRETSPHWHIRYNEDPDYYVEADIAEASKFFAHVNLYPKNEDNLASDNIVYDDYDSFANFLRMRADRESEN